MMWQLSCRLEFCKSRLSVCTVCRSLEPGEYVQCDIWRSGQDSDVGRRACTCPSFFSSCSVQFIFFHSFVMALNRPIAMPEAFSGEATDERDWPAYLDYFAECSALNGWQADGQDHRAIFLSVRLRGVAQRFASTLPLQADKISRYLQGRWESVLPQLAGRRSIRQPLKLVASCRMSPS